jgi:hypothetical protein
MFLKVLNNGALDTNENSIIKDKKIDKKSQRVLSTKIIPSISGTLMSSNKEKGMKALLERPKMNQIKKRSYGINNQIFDDVTDIYAVGLAVNK